MHQAISNVKFKALAKRLGLPMFQAVGVLESLWLFAQIQARDGDLTKYSELEIAGWIEWDGDDAALIDALVETRWLDRVDGALMVHDWAHHCPNYLKGTLAAKAKRDAAEETPKTPPKTGSRTPPKDPPRTPPRAGSREGTPNLTQPNPSAAASASVSAEPTEPPPKRPTSADRFVEIWNATDGVTPCRKVSGKRLAALRARVAELVPIDDCEVPWLDALAVACGTKFPLPLTRGSPDGWKPDADWILRPDSLLRVLEGKYDWIKSSQAGDRVTPSHSATQRFLAGDTTLVRPTDGKQNGSGGGGQLALRGSGSAGP